MQTIRCKNALKGPYWIGESCIESPLPSGWLPGDKVNPETGEYERSNKHPLLVGIIDFTNRTRYGYTNKGVPLYLFYPLDVRYPPMIVGSKAPTTANQFGLVQFSGMETGKAKWPRGALQQLLGTVGDSAVELKALRLHVRCDPQTSLEYNTIEEKEQLSQQEWDFTFNIDPAGCQDIDDVISWRTNKDGSMDFAISIADVSYWVPIGSELDRIAKQRGQTVYENGTVLYPMLPTSISEQSASLHSDSIPRPVLSLIWTIQSDGIRICEKPRWSSQSLVNNRTFTYESILEEKEICKKLCWCLEKITQQTFISQDPHNWIELAMITYNKHAAASLMDAGKGILRRHAGRITQEDYSTLAEKTGCRDIAWLGASAGEYIPVRSEDTFHTGLGVSYYCHASSPLRRYADLVNQRILKSGVSVDSNYSQLSQQLNDRSKAIKAFERDVWYLQHISPTSLTACDGWILTIKPTNDVFFKATVYVPKWKRKVHVRIPDPTIWNVGDLVSITVFCDLRKASYTDRYVFSILKPESDSDSEVIDSSRIGMLYKEIK